MVTVKWLPEALDDITRLYDFLKEKRNPQAASKAATTILNASRVLKTTPRIVRPTSDETGNREFFAAFGAGAYVLRYRYEAKEAVVIIRVWHSREDRDNLN